MPKRFPVSYRWNGSIMTLDEDTSGAWDTDASVRLEVQADARLLAASHMGHAEIRDANGHLLEVVRP